MSKDPLLQPLRIKHLTLKNRIMSTSHACGLEEGGMPTEAYQAYHEEKAKGGLALTMFGGSSNVAPDSPNVFRQLNVGVDEIIPHLQRFSARIHRHGAALMCQITHLGRRGESYAQDWLPTIAPSPVRETLHRAVPKEMDAHDIARVVAAFGDAAWRCKEGGLDGVETLAGAHLIGQFLSPATNRRGDGFGGSLENRCRFGLMVFEEMRRRIGDDFLLGFRFVVDEGHEAGLCFEDCLAIAKDLPGLRPGRLLQRDLRPHGHFDRARRGQHAGHGEPDRALARDGGRPSSGRSSCRCSTPPVSPTWRPPAARSARGSWTWSA